MTISNRGPHPWEADAYHLAICPRSMHLCILVPWHALLECETIQISIGGGVYTHEMLPKAKWLAAVATEPAVVSPKAALRQCVTAVPRFDCAMPFCACVMVLCSPPNSRFSVLLRKAIGSGGRGPPAAPQHLSRHGYLAAPCSVVGNVLDCAPLVCAHSP